MGELYGEDSASLMIFEANSLDVCHSYTFHGPYVLMYCINCISQISQFLKVEKVFVLLRKYNIYVIIFFIRYKVQKALHNRNDSYVP